MKILAIETSCDETSVAVVDARKLRLKYDINVLSHMTSSQIQTHARYGGVVPEVAARKHAENFMDVFELALKKAKITSKNIDVIAVTYGPGLVTSLMVGVTAAQTLSYTLNLPLIPVNHMKGHMYSSFIGETRAEKEIFPALVLTVSGGHTELVLMRGYERFKKIGQTQDDAAGEAFDKIAKMLGLGYPGGPKISKLAEQGDPGKYEFPRPLLYKPNFDFSFSGLKTSVLYFLRDVRDHRNQRTHQKRGQKSADTHLDTQKKFSSQFVADVCAGVECAIVDCLVTKTLRAAEHYKVNTVVLGGGVSANKKLRHDLERALLKQFPNVTFMRPDFEYCTDNAAMIAVAGYFQYVSARDKNKYRGMWGRIDADPTLDIA